MEIQVALMEKNMSAVATFVDTRTWVYIYILLDQGAETVDQSEVKL